MLEYFFAHYDPWVTRYFIHDDGSDDGTVEALSARENVTITRLRRHDPESWVLSAKHVYETSWLSSRGEADWVVVANIDEHLHHSNMAEYLARQRQDGVTAVPALGYQMLAEDWPRPGSLLWRDYPYGAPWENMSKLQIFRPDRISAVEFSPGRHRTALDGDVVLPPRDEVANLHYKYLGVVRTAARHATQNDRLGRKDHARGWGHKYQWTDEELGADFDCIRAQLVSTLDSDYDHAHVLPRWWRREGVPAIQQEVSGQMG